MKHLTTILAAVLCAVCLSGCVGESQMGKVNADQRWLNEIDDKIVTAEYRGHSYIIYKGVEKGGITHDPDCPCQNSRTLKQLLTDTAFLNQFHQASERAAAEATTETADARRRAMGYSPKLTEGGEE